jgi:hypothetical protein
LLQLLLFFNCGSWVYTIFLAFANQTNKTKYVQIPDRVPNWTIQVRIVYVKLGPKRSSKIIVKYFTSRLGPIRSSHLVATNKTEYIQFRTWSEFGQFSPELSAEIFGPIRSTHLVTTNKTFFVYWNIWSDSVQSVSSE